MQKAWKLDIPTELKHFVDFDKTRNFKTTRPWCFRSWLNGK